MWKFLKQSLFRTHTWTTFSAALSLQLVHLNGECVLFLFALQLTLLANIHLQNIRTKSSFSFSALSFLQSGFSAKLFCIEMQIQKSLRNTEITCIETPDFSEQAEPVLIYRMHNKKTASKRFLKIILKQLVII